MMKKVWGYLLFLSVLSCIVTIITSCNNGIEPLLPLVNNEVRATITDYGGFVSKDAITQYDGVNYIVKAGIKGESGDDTIVVTLVIPKRDALPYTIGVQSDPSAQIDLCIQQTTGTCINYDVKEGLGSGAITVSSITSDGTNKIMEGTYSGTLQPSAGTTTKTITNGEFKVILP
jgi:hypothetical protein